MNAKLGIIIAGAIVVIIAAYFAVRPNTPQKAAPMSVTPETSTPSSQYLHDHPAELKTAKANCSQGTAPSQLYCYNVEKAEELVAADAYSKAAEGGAKAK